VYLNLGMTTLQVLVPDEMRGRVMGIWSMTWFLSAIGGFVAGAMAEVLGVPWTVAVGGLSVAGFAALLFTASGELRTLHAPNAIPEPAATAV
jgi:MFS family permease